MFEVKAEFCSCTETKTTGCKVQVGTRVDSSKEHHGFVEDFHLKVPQQITEESHSDTFSMIHQGFKFSQRFVPVNQPEGRLWSPLGGWSSTAVVAPPPLAPLWLSRGEELDSPVTLTVNTYQ